VAKTKTREERLFSAAVLRRSFELQEARYQDGFKFVYEGVLRDLGLEERDVEEYLAAHREEVEKAIGRRGKTS
jgi:CRP-like cAMP-binding protein